MTKLNGQSLNIEAENIEQLKAIFPDVFTEDKVDFGKLRQVLGEYVDDETERYNFTWNGKGKALRFAQTPSQATLRPCKEDSKDWDSTKNLYIEGDNLEVLKLLQKSYFNKVKMIYIDPPYNTGNDFVYPDNYADNLQHYKEITGQIDADGKKISTNAESNGRYHTDWLNMMYPRLRLARNLLTDDGVIFISIDDHEQSNLKKICDEIFGEDNFVANMIWESKYTVSNDAKYVSNQHENILFYSKNMSAFKMGRLDRTEKQNESYKNRDNDPKGPWKPTPIHAKSGTEKSKYSFVFENGREWHCPAGRYPRYSQDTLLRLYQSGELYFNSNNGVDKKTYLAEVESKGVVPGSVIKYHDVGHTHANNEELASIVGKGIFDNPKGTSLLKRLMKLANLFNDSTILDFFSGSSTTAHATMQLNAEDGGNRKFIMVQLPEPCKGDTEAFKVGYSTIAEIGKERIRRAGEKIKEQVEADNKSFTVGQHELGGNNKLGGDNKKVPDIGFKVFKLDSSNIRKWQPDYDNLEKTISDAVENYVDGRSELDVVYEIILKMGHDLTYPLTTHTIAEKNVYSIGFGGLMLCLDNHITTAVAEGMAKLYQELKPEVWKVVFKDNGFKSDSDKVNIREILKLTGLNNEDFVTV